MSNIVKFPTKIERLEVGPEKDIEAKAKGKAGLVGFVWIATVLVWPVLKWVLSIEVFFQFIRMVYYWNTPEVHAGLIFLLHFAALTAITYFVSLYKPKRI